MCTLHDWKHSHDIPPERFGGHVWSGIVDRCARCDMVRTLWDHRPVHVAPASVTQAPPIPYALDSALA